MRDKKENSLSNNPADRKAAPMAEGLLWYFPNALAAVAAVSKAGNDYHNPGQPLHHSRGKSMDHADCIIRHLVDAGRIDSDGIRHSAKVAWRALALLQEELEREEGAPLPRNARLPELNNDDGWRRHDGGPCPVPIGTRVHVRHRDGEEYFDVRACVADDIYAVDWPHEEGDHPGDIVAWRLSDAGGV